MKKRKRKIAGRKWGERGYDMQDHPNASDDNDGSKEVQFKTVLPGPFAELESGKVYSIDPRH